MTFTHDGNKTYFDGLVNFEKMVSELHVVTFLAPGIFMFIHILL